MSKAKILIVEDEFVIAESMSMTLINLGYNVIDYVSKGEAAIEIAKNKKPDLILMDISLAGKMDGIEAAQHINLNYNIPVIYLTAHIDDKLIARAKITEPFGYLIKPVEEKILQCTIEIALYKLMLDKQFKTKELYFQGVMDNITYPLMVIGFDYRIKMMNEAAKKWISCTYYPYGELFCFKVSHHKNVPCFGKKEQCPLEYVSSTFKSIKVTHEHFTKDGEVRVIEIMASPLITKDGSFDSIIETHIDITERLKTEKTINKGGNIKCIHLEKTQMHQ
ncbi:MAG: response regulator [Nitrospirae bacterium]|nr:response regulator [Nitrospirota bacterium]MBF0539867.1 response regulator [Nitrospirota bacterium]